MPVSSPFSRSARQSAASAANSSGSTAETAAGSIPSAASAPSSPLPRLEKLDQRLAVVGQQQEVVRHPADFDMEELPVRRAPGIEHRDRRPGGPPLRRMRRRAVVESYAGRLLLGAPALACAVAT